MTSNSRIPQHLAPYVERIPKDSLILLTGTLSNNANWLVVRYLCDAFSNDASLKNRPAGDISDGGAATREEVGVVLVSWMRDFEFWKTEARRSGVSVVCYHYSDHSTNAAM
jgi:elongator complex protein 6